MIEHRFRKYIGEPTPSGCLPWIGAKSSTGYGVLNVDGKVRGAHRLAYELAHGLIPDGLQVMHACDNRICVNASHLKLGTPVDNMRDMIQKGRDRHEGFQGEEHPAAKLSEGDVLEILSLLAAGNTQKETARIFNVSRTTIGRIGRGEGWRCVSLPQTGTVVQ